MEQGTIQVLMLKTVLMKETRWLLSPRFACIPLWKD